MKTEHTFEQVTMYKKEDGELFNTVDECIKYQRNKDLVALLSDSIYELDFDSAEEVLEIIERNKELFLDYLNSL